MGSSKTGGNKPQAKNDAQTLEQNVQEENQEVMIPLSEVDKLIEEKLQKALASQPQQTSQEPTVKIIEKVVEQKKSSDNIPGLEDFEFKDRLYVTIGYEKAVSQNIQSRPKKNQPLQWTNPETKKVYSLRYATNQSSIFVEEQQGDAIVEHISLKNGKLFVPKENVILQKFLAIHPKNGITFKELDKEVESKKLLEEEDLAFEARVLARDMSFVKQTAMARLLCKDYTDVWTSGEIKLALYAKAAENPRAFIKLAKDPTLEKKGIASLAKFRGLIALKNKTWYNADNQVMTHVTPGQDDIDALIAFFATPNGTGMYEYLKNAVS